MKMFITYERVRNIASAPCDRAIRMARSPSEAALMLTRAASSFNKWTGMEYGTLERKHGSGEHHRRERIGDHPDRMTLSVPVL